MPFLPLIEEIEYRDPAAALAAIAAAPGLVLLDSAMAHPTLGRWSWLGVDPFGRFTSEEGRTYWNGRRLPDPPIDELRRLLRRYSEPEPAPLPFAGGASGMFSYEAGRLFEALPGPKGDQPTAPEVELYFHDVGIAFDVVDRRAFLVSTGRPEDELAYRRRRAEERLAQVRDLLSSDAARRRKPPICISREAWRANMNAAEFKAKVERTRRYIADGDIFQANLAQAFRAELPKSVDPLALYAQLRSANPAPFGAFVMTPDRIVASTSPEGFLLLRDGEVETRPIKGTRPRSSDPAEDSRLAQELIRSEKDRAENIMIVDLMRNDLSRVCLAGTVKVPILCGLESYESVHHLVSVVRGKLKPGLDALHLMAACFPGGSITGAPKIRAMEIIHELEPEPRGIYCGSIVHFGFDGSLRSNIAIRTLVVEGGVASIRAGGGITLLSDPEEEYSETLIKAERMLQAFEPVPGRDAVS